MATTLNHSAIDRRYGFELKNYGVFAIALLLNWPQPLTAQVAPLPGLPATEGARTASLYALYQQKVGSYTVHTQHLNSDGSPKYVNALITEDSPYLKQHVHNPVNWFPWGEGLFAPGKPVDRIVDVLLQVG